MRVGEARDIAIAPRGLGERDQHGRHPAQQQLQPLAHQDKVGVVGDVGARRAEVDEGACRRRLLTQMVDVCHHVVADALLVLRRALEIGIVQVGAQLRERPLRDVDAQLPLDLHEGEPQPAPQPDPSPLPPQGLHRRGGVALGQG